MAVDDDIDVMLRDGDEDTTTADDEQDLDEASSEDPLEDKPELQKALIDLYEKCKGEDRYQRLIEVKDVKQSEFYWTGRQYIWWSNDDKQWNLPTQQASNYGDLNIEDMPRFEFVTNIYQARGLMVIGAVAGAPPRVRFFPDDADDADDIETAEGRTKLTKLIERWNPLSQMLQQETYHAYTGGLICWWTRYVANGEKYGFDSTELLSQGEEQVDESIKCPKCGWSAPAMNAEPPVPCPVCGTQLTEDDIVEEEPMPTIEETGIQNIPKGRQVISIYGALNCCRPQHVDSQSDFHYFGIEEEVHYSKLRAAFEQVEDKITPGLNQGADDIFERNARLSVSGNTRLYTQTGANQANLCTFVRCWFRPTAFKILEDKAHRKELLEIFPRGVRIEFTGNVFCKSEAESMDDAIVTQHAMPGRGQHRPAIGTSMLSIQDRVNTFSNIEAETYEYGIPITYRAADTWDSGADDEQRAAPGLEVEVALRAGENIQQRIMQVRADSVSPDMAEHTKELIGPIADQLSGAYPAVSGSGEANPDTLGQQVMQRDQAMGRMGIFWVNLRQGHADIMTLACRCFEAHSDGIVKVPVLGESGDFESESIDVTALEGEAEAYPEGDEHFPETIQQQKATMMQIMDTPQGATLAQDPENAEIFAKLIGICGLKIPGVDSRQKQLKEISELIKIPEGDDIMEALAPMVEVDPECDDHTVEAATCKWWLNSAKGQKCKRENPMGWRAVKEHMLKHLAAIPKPEPQNKPLSPTMTTAYKDLPPEAQAQWLEKEFGIKVSPQDFIQQVLLEQAKKSGGKPAPGQEPPAARPTGQPANVPVGGV